MHSLIITAYIKDIHTYVHSYILYIYNVTQKSIWTYKTRRQIIIWLNVMLHTYRLQENNHVGSAGSGLANF